MKNKKKIRNIQEGRLPSGPLSEGEVILSPENPMGYLKRRLTVVKTLFKAVANTNEARRQTMARQDISFSDKMRRMKADVDLESTKSLYAPQTMYDAGFRVAECGCSPGKGHRAPIRPSERKGRAICKVGNRRGKRNKRG